MPLRESNRKGCKKVDASKAKCKENAFCNIDIGIIIEICAVFLRGRRLEVRHPLLGCNGFERKVFGDSTGEERTVLSAIDAHTGIDGTRIGMGLPLSGSAALLRCLFLRAVGSDLSLGHDQSYLPLLKKPINPAITATNSNVGMTYTMAFIGLTESFSSYWA